MYLLRKVEKGIQMGQGYLQIARLPVPLFFRDMYFTFFYNGHIDIRSMLISSYNLAPIPMRHFALLIIFAAFSYQVCHSQDTNRPKMVVVFSGGGAKGYDSIPRKQLDQYTRIEQQRYILSIPFGEEKTSDLNIGMRLNTNSAVSIVLNSKKKDYTKSFGLLSLTADISSNPKVNFLLEFDKKDLPKIALMIDGMYKNLNVYLDKDHSYPTELYVASAKIFSIERVTNNLTVGSGIKQEHYSGKLYSVVNDTNPTFSAREKSITHLFGYLTFDNLDDYYFPTNGTEVHSEISLAQDMPFTHTNPIVLFKMRNIIRLSKSYSILLNIYGRSVLTETAPRYLGNFVGGHDYEIFLDQQLPFYGLPTLWPTGRFSFIGLTGLRINIAKHHYIKLAGNFLMYNNEFSPFNRYETIWGSGFTYAYKSPIGPLEFTIAYSDRYQKPTISANTGFWF